MDECNRILIMFWFYFVWWIHWWSLFDVCISRWRNVL